MKKGFRIELRIVVSRLNAEDMENIAELIATKMQGISYVSIMAMEMTGSAYIHRDQVWIPYRQAAEKIENGIR